ncbi:putative ferric-chelate reductase 1 homolog [Hyalella azteca]|uniref:Ferric-chelate reductase 1 homolog n=1 Tax=Hyalella azteca TaxID=294128 RepID=A0A8B7NF93_HYAAZ|nr:putative ferric-chelate reductase 1 homolog [Hyalella azteca]
MPRVHAALLACVFLAVTLFVSGSLGFSSGSVSLACDSMYPLHLTLGPQRSPSPFIIHASKEDNSTIRVTLTSEAETFRGFFLQARDKDDQRVGKFLNVQGGGQILRCDEEGNSVSHKSPEDKQQVSMTWVPLQHRGAVIFQATVVQRYNTFWTNIRSRMYNVS